MMLLSLLTCAALAPTPAAADEQLVSSIQSSGSRQVQTGSDGLLPLEAA